MKLTQTQLRAVTLGCGLLLVGFGIAKGLLHLDLGERVERWITNGLFIVAAVALLQMYKLRREAARAGAGKPPEQPPQ